MRQAVRGPTTRGASHLCETRSGPLPALGSLGRPSRCCRPASPEIVRDVTADCDGPDAKADRIEDELTHAGESMTVDGPGRRRPYTQLSGTVHDWGRRTARNGAAPGTLAARQTAGR